MKCILTSNSYMVTDSWIKKLELTPSEMSVAFIDTAGHHEGEPMPSWLNEDRKALIAAGFHVSDYTLIGKTRDTLINDLSLFDIFFVAGGNTFYLLEHANKSGFCDLIREDYFKDKIYVGSSAGSVLLSQDIDAIHFLDDASVMSTDDYRAIGVCPFVIFPHWGSPKFAEAYKKTFAYAYERNIPFLTLPDTSYVTMINGVFTYETH